MTGIRKKLSWLLLAIGIPFVIGVHYFANELNLAKYKRDKTINEANKSRDKAMFELYVKVEELTRKQMRLNLQNAKNGLEKFIEVFKIDMLDFEQRNIALRIFTNYMTYYNEEGNTFVVNTNGEFDLDDDHDCGQPMSLVDPSIPLINLPTRKRYFWDEIAWQLELKYFLYEYGITNNFDKENLKYVSEKIPVYKKFDLDLRLNNVNIYHTEEIEYIENKYPQLFSLLRDYKVIMHSDYKFVEPVLNFLNTHRESDEKTNLYWFFNQHPYKEALEVVWLPSEKIGFNGIEKSYAGGSTNPDYLRVGLVQGSQIERIFEEYKPVVDVIKETCAREIETANYVYNSRYKQDLILILIVSVMFIYASISLSHSMLKIRK